MFFNLGSLKWFVDLYLYGSERRKEMRKKYLFRQKTDNSIVLIVSLVKVRLWMGMKIQILKNVYL